MIRCPSCSTPLPPDRKYCSAACRNKDWSLKREFGDACIEDGVVSRGEAVRYLQQREAVQRAIRGACMPIDMRGRKFG